MEYRIAIDDTIELTALQPGDKENLLLYLNDAEVQRNTLRIPCPYTEQDAEEWLVRTKKNLADYGTLVNWAVRHREAGVIGGIGAFVKNGIEGHSDEIGYWLAAPYRGRGLMTKVVAAFCDYLFDSRPALLRIEAWVFAQNPASLRVLEKAGFEREGYARKMFFKEDHPIDGILLARLRP